MKGKNLTTPSVGIVFQTSAEAKAAGWFSRRHQTREAHEAARRLRNEKIHRKHKQAPASIEDLLKRSNEGDLGNLLAQKFKGIVGHTYARKDSEFLVLFKSEGETPSARQIAKVVMDHYKILGYILEQMVVHGDSFVVHLRVHENFPFIHINITTHYPHNTGYCNGRYNSMRVTTTVVGL